MISTCKGSFDFFLIITEFRGIQWASECDSADVVYQCQEMIKNERICTFSENYKLPKGLNKSIANHNQKAVYIIYGMYCTQTKYTHHSVSSLHN